ncbi:sugar ABC transporter ATP-binding protein [Thermogladius sp. KZ2Tp1]|uniref:sugar ABC transporter ATP-binding protein n=1 Tax=Thermogladius sp. KZ2Tp1 TaxID=3136289 RepID=UPI003DA8838A
MWWEIHTLRCKDAPILELRGISKSFPGVKALDNIDLDLYPCEIHCLLGQNGAGKSTLLKIIAGIISPDKGKITFEGREVSFKSPRESRKHGIVLVHQELTVLPSLTVLENVELLGEMSSWSVITPFNKRVYTDKVKSVFESLGVRIDLNEKVKDLRASEKTLTQIAASLTMNAKLLLLDEPTSPLSREEIEHLFKVMRRLKENGISIIFITHRVEEAFEICDKISILRNGVKLGTFPASKLSREEVIRLMIGSDLSEFYYIKSSTTQPAGEGAVLLSVRNMSTNPLKPVEVRLKNISFDLYKGEILAVLGLLGSGKTELGKSLVGLQYIESGTIYIEGRPVIIKSPVDAKRYGIVYLPEDRRNEGLFLSRPILHNMTISSLDKYSRLFIIDGKSELNDSMKVSKSLNLVFATLLDRVLKLSGGNQQKVLLSRALLANPKILILDEPTIGIDVGSKHEIRRLVYNMVRDRGISVIWLTSDVDEALGVSDRIMILHDGRVKNILKNENLNREVLIKML